MDEEKIKDFIYKMLHSFNHDPSQFDQDAEESMMNSYRTGMMPSLIDELPDTSRDDPDMTMRGGFTGNKAKRTTGDTGPEILFRELMKRRNYR